MNKQIFSIAACVLFCSLVYPSYALDNGLVKTPPMGWNSWNVFHENINEKQIKEIADVMVSSGMRDAGYIYLNLDDNWMATSRDANGDLRADPTRFPSGMKALGDYIHSKGLKFGIYGDRGRRTCHHYNNNMDTHSGSYGNETRDAKMFASWGVDYLKYDNCDPAPGSNQQKDYENMRDALASSGRAIVFSICAWGYASWMPNVGNLWRTTGDISNSWETAAGGFFQGVSNIIDLNEKFAPNASPGGWNDPDMLQVGNGKLTNDESRSHMSMWAIMAAPLITGNDIRTMSATTKELYMNPEVIAVNQDSAGIQGRRISATNKLEVWSKPLKSANSSIRAVALLNRSGSTADITVNFADIGLSGEVQVRDLWAKTDKGSFSTSYHQSVPSHGTVLLRIQKPELPPVPQSPFKSEQILRIPGKIEAENYDLGSEGLAYHDVDAINSGAIYRTDGVDITGDSASGYKLGWTVAEEWVEYTVNIETPSVYNWEMLVSSEGDDASVKMTLDSTIVIAELIKIPNTGKWDTYQTIKGTTPELPKGEHILRVSTVGSYYNLDWIRFELPTVKIIPSIPNRLIYPIRSQTFDLLGRSHQYTP